MNSRVLGSCLLLNSRIQRKWALLGVAAFLAVFALSLLHSRWPAPCPAISMASRCADNSASAASSIRKTIPKIIHQTFATTRVFSAYRKHIEHCLRLNPGWQYFLWRDEDILAFINDHYPYFMRKYLVFKMYVQRGDSIRYMALHHYGGIYIDMDVECVQPFFPRLSNLTAFVDQEAKEHAVLLYKKPFSAMNSAMGSVRGHPFFLGMVIAMMEVPDARGGAGGTTGPDLLTDQLVKWRADRATQRHSVTLLEPEVFSPLIDAKNLDYQLVCSKVLKDFRSSTAKSARLKPNQTLYLKAEFCRKYTDGNFQADRTNDKTVGRHLFLHLGYRWNKSLFFGLYDIFRNYFGYFEITEAVGNVQFYAVHRML